MDAPKGLASYLDTVEGEEVDSSSVFERFDWLSSPYLEIFFRIESNIFLHFRLSPHLIWSFTFNSLLWRYYGGTIQHFHLQHSYQTLLKGMRWHSVQNPYQTLLKGMQSSLTGFFRTTGVEGLDLDFAAGEGRSSKSPNTGAISGVLRIWKEFICTSIAGGCFCSPAPCPRSSPFFSTGFRWQI